MSRRLARTCSLVALVAALLAGSTLLAGCCSDCIKAPPCCPKPAPPK